jgi:3-methyl-2-oxobutanoate hydroxymethyltransferase
LKIRTQSLSQLKSEGKKFAALTSYDTLTAGIFDEAGIEVLLVGDSASDNVLGHESTLPITIDEIVSFGKAVSRAANSALVVVDMPFGSYESSVDLAVQNAIRIMKESGAAAVKLEGGINRVEQIKAIVNAGIPVMGHVGFTPQSVHSLGGYKVQGRGEAAQKVFDDVRAVESAGAFAVVLEMIPADLASEISQSVKIPTIGIGAGSGTDGQILVWTDFAGLGNRSPSFSKAYLNLRDQLLEAAKTYRSEVTAAKFPSAEQNFS